jgi:integrase
LVCLHPAIYKRAGVKCPLYEGTKQSLSTPLTAVGVEDRVIQQLFGHADIRSVQTYARIEDATLREVMARLHPLSAAPRELPC